MNTRSTIFSDAPALTDVLHVERISNKGDYLVITLINLKQSLVQIGVFPTYLGQIIHFYENNLSNECKLRKSNHRGSLSSKFYSQTTSLLKIFKQAGLVHDCVWTLLCFLFSAHDIFSICVKEIPGGFSANMMLSLCLVWQRKGAVLLRMLHCKNIFLSEKDELFQWCSNCF